MFPPSKEDELLQMIANGQEEYLQLEFKRADSLNNTDANKKEISKDVSAFANTIGGTILYGIDEAPDPPRKATALSPIDPVRTSKEWLEQVINSRIQPRISGVVIQPIDLSTMPPKHVAYAVTVPEGMTAYQASDHRYYRRYNFESVPMLDHEIRYVMNRASKPAYRLWLKASQVMSVGQKAVVHFRATVVNTSEITPHDVHAVLYLPSMEFELSGEDWDFTVIEGQMYRRFAGTVTQAWNPDHPSDVEFYGATPHISPSDPTIPPAGIFVRLFDSYGLALTEEYRLEVHPIHARVVGSTSDRRQPEIRSPKL